MVTGEEPDRFPTKEMSNHSIVGARFCMETFISWFKYVFLKEKLDLLQSSFMPNISDCKYVDVVWNGPTSILVKKITYSYVIWNWEYDRKISWSIPHFYQGNEFFEIKIDWWYLMVWLWVIFKLNMTTIECEINLLEGVIIDIKEDIVGG